MDRLRELPDGRIEKQCSKCEEWKAIPGEFRLAANSPDGFAWHCKDCVSDRQSDWFARRYHSDPDFLRRNIDQGQARRGGAKATLRLWLARGKGGK